MGLFLVPPPACEPLEPRLLLNAAFEPVASYPFVEDFEAGSLGSHWTVRTYGSDAIAAVTSEGDPRGDFHLELAGGDWSGSAMAVLHLDLLDNETPLSDVVLGFRKKGQGESYLRIESYCPGYRPPVVDPIGTAEDYAYYEVDLDQAAAQHNSPLRV